jgi:integrase/recombinase XerD
MRIKGENIAKRTQMQFQDLFTPGELESLLNRESRYENLRLRNKIIISLLIYQGLTSDEITRIDLDNIDLDKMSIYIKGSAKLSSRTLKLHQVQKEYIETYLKVNRKLILKVVATAW